MARYRIGAHLLDLDALELRDGEDTVDIEPQALKVLSYLVANRHRVVPKTELLDEVWGDRFVSQSALATRIKQCRRLLGDDGRTQAVIRTAHGVGYRFVAEVNEEPGPGPASENADAPRSDAVPLLAADRPLFGRDRKLAALGHRLGDHRLVTVTGPGGVGKSTLVAQWIATDAAAPGEAWNWCELATTRDPDALATVVLGAIGEAQQSDADPFESALRALERRTVVVVLDNCEHLAAAAAAFVTEVLRRCPDVRVVATSRVPLHVPGESLLPLGPLALDDAVDCFCARALDVGSELDPADPAVVELCRRLDGIPLALELAAARSLILTPDQMVDLLHHRFRLLADPAADSTERQRSLLRTVQWSWEALDGSDQELLASLSVLVGAFSLEDAAAVAGHDGDVIGLAEAMGRLVQVSLVTVDSGTGPHGRFRLLETIRDYAGGQLTDPGSVERRHAQHFAARAEGIDHGPLQSEGIDDGLAEMRAMWSNLRAAVGHAASAGDVHTVGRIIRSVGSYADFFGSFEVLEWCAEADADLDAAPDEELPLVADVVAIEARLRLRRGELEDARASAAAARAAHESHHTVLSTAWCDVYSLDVAGAAESGARLRTLSRSERGMDRAFADGIEAFAAGFGEGDEPRCSPVHAGAVPEGVLGTFDCLVTAFGLVTTDPGRATRTLSAVMEVSLENDYRLFLNIAGITLTRLHASSGATLDGMRTVRGTLTEYLDRGMWVSIMTDVVTAARLLAREGDVEVACRLLGSRAASGYDAGLSEIDHQELRRELLAAGEERFTSLAAEGSRWSPTEAAQVAIAALDRHLATGSVSS